MNYEEKSVNITAGQTRQILTSFRSSPVAKGRVDLGGCPPKPPQILQVNAEDRVSGAEILLLESGDHAPPVDPLVRASVAGGCCPG